MTLVSCLHCGRVVSVIRELPDHCAYCGAQAWRTMDERPESEYAPPLALTKEDRRFLKALRISSDDL